VVDARGWATASITTLLSLKSLCGGGVPSSHPPPLGCLFSFFLVCSENRRGTAKRDRKRQTPKGGRRIAHDTPLLKIPVWWRRAVLPSASLPCFLSFWGVCERLRCEPWRPWGYLTQKHNPRPKTHKHRQSRRERQQRQSEASAECLFTRKEFYHKLLSHDTGQGG